MRNTRVRRLMRNRRIMALVAVVAIAVLAVPVAVFAKPPAADGPAKVAICHFDGHDDVTPFPADGVTVDGDYVINFPPSPTFCEGKGGRMLIVSVNALTGHGVQLLDRVNDYDDGWKG